MKKTIEKPTQNQQQTQKVSIQQQAQTTMYYDERQEALEKVELIVQTVVDP